ncbi:hypothetical protein FH972_024720 [Carpinus fangiana]|uniref:ATP-grasp domain-containing protein n=1 Tax=Carpinus fangiana TaxID=176857 RepID=A0A5N6KZ61_9ROSI|nr:hypothetical protein FH972_024720 [Carpinus fangiana]
MVLDLERVRSHPAESPANVHSALSSEENSRPYSLVLRANPVYDSFVVRSVDLVMVPLEYGIQSQDKSIFVVPRDLRSMPDLGGSKSGIRMFLEKILRKPTALAVKLIIPSIDGHVTQSNIIETRFHGCPDVESAVGFFPPGELIKAYTAKISTKPVSTSQLYDLLMATAGAIKVNSSCNAPWKALDRLEYEFRNRLGLRLLLPKPIPRKRVGLVRCKDDQMSMELIRHLGIDLVVFDAPGHFMEDSNGDWAHLRVSFHPVDLNPDKDFVERLHLVAKDLNLDGITTRFDPLLEKVAQVAGLLELPSTDPSVFGIATNKYLARIAVPEDGQNAAICVSTRQEMEERLGDRTRPLQITYPVVVKPTQGRSSFGVVKALNECELLDAVERAASFIVGCGGEMNIHPDVMIEPYVDGPEVDINIAMWEGQVLFYEVSDNAPTAGDSDEQSESAKKDFQENLFMYPSQLPQSEQAMVYQHVRDCILRIGFRTGVFHCEARVRNSCMHYVKQINTGIIDLESKVEMSENQPSIFLIEINCRPPGYFGLYATTWAYGVDLWGLHILRCIGDESRFRALSAPFHNGPQHDSAVLLVMPEKGGILRSEDPWPRLEKERPELAACVPLYKNFVNVGDQVISPDEVITTFTSIVVIESKKGSLLIKYWITFFIMDMRAYNIPPKQRWIFLTVALSDTQDGQLFCHTLGYSHQGERDGNCIFSRTNPAALTVSHPSLLHRDSADTMVSGRAMASNAHGCRVSLKKTEAIMKRDNGSSKKKSQAFDERYSEIMASSGSHIGLPTRYEIRRLGPEHMVWAKAIVLHANLFQSPVWKQLHAGELTEKLMAGLSPSVDYLFTHQVNSGLSWGIFDTEYVFKNPASATRGGALYWDPKDTSSTGEQLLEQMDFPLASVALAYDGINRLDYALLGPLVELLPAYSTIMDALGTLDTRDPKSWEATAPNQVLMRNATATRADYANNGQRLVASTSKRRNDGTIDK